VNRGLSRHRSQLRLFAARQPNRESRVPGCSSRGSLAPDRL